MSRSTEVIFLRDDEQAKNKLSHETMRRANAVTRFIHMRDVYFFYVQTIQFVSSENREKASVTIPEKIINHLATRKRDVLIDCVETDD